MTEERANATKARTDQLAGELLGSGSKVQKMAQEISALLFWEDPLHLCISGGAGSGKSSVARRLAKILDVPVFDFDEFIPGGYHRDPKVYRKRFVDGMSSLWDALPRGPWIVEHVEACNDEMLRAFKPNAVLHLSPPASHAMSTAAARSAVAGEGPEEQYGREQRALESAVISSNQFSKTPGKVIGQGRGWVLKKLG